MKKFILHDRVIFSPEDNKLTPLGARGRDVVLHVPVSRILFLLLSKAGSIVSQEDIYKEVWENYGQKVTPNTLYQNVSLLRKALKTAGLIAVTIKTHPKSGFSFFGKVELSEEDDARDDQTLTNPFQSREADIAGPEGSDRLNDNFSEIHTQSLPPRGLLSECTRRYWPVLMTVALLALLCVSLVWLLPSGKDTEFTVEQKIVGRVNNCPVYIDRGNHKVDLTKIMAYLREKGTSCIEHDFLYLTKAPYVNQVIVMSCRSTDEVLNCHLLMKLPSYLIPDSGVIPGQKE
ncbi:MULTISPECIES: winged helix-turn-helix domain-containing protein [Enterobacter]|uniref:winged helix-turn-helix domain-containing protein n=1 Tax=Enterobacter TaxID=547 RepID=UPI000DCB4AE4|nr:MULTISPECIES: winged helix-turn-helix domain-containing protein [Enterobacter]QLY00845.1 winged helix-turn-helix domain-containing protein [Enterobacter sp. RHBSTW-00593]RAY76621.1 hypothetical protein DP199_02850 [Enterobacter kobei]